MKKGPPTKLPITPPLLSKIYMRLSRTGAMVFSCLLLLAMAIHLTGCTQLPNPNAPVTLTFSTWGSAEEITVLKTLIQRFEQTHPRIRIRLMHIPENYFQKLHILIAGGLTPDVMFVNSLNYAVYADNNIFLPLEPLMATPEAPLPRSAFFASSLKAFTWKQRLYAIPRDVSNLVVFYNRDMFRQAGLPEPTPSWTMADLLRLSQQLTRDTDGDGQRDVFGISFFGKPPLLWLPFVWSHGGDLYSSDFTHLRLTEPATVNAIQFMADLRNRWHVAPTRQEVGSATMSQLFLQGKLAMLLSGRWTVPVLRTQAPFAWDVVPFPRGAAGSVVGIDASGYVIARDTAHPKESWAFIQYLSQPQAQTILAQSGLIVPARQDVARSPEFLAGDPRHSRAFIDAIATGYPSHTPIRWNEVSEELGLALEPVWEGTQRADTALKRVAPKLRKLLP